MSTKFASNGKRVTLNRKPTEQQQDDSVVEANDYTRQLVESALSRTEATPLVISALNNKKTAMAAAVSSCTASSPQHQVKNPSRLHLLLEKNNCGDKVVHTTLTTSTPLPMLKPSLRSPNSAPCTPVTKSVHFDNNLENICLFRKAQTPSAIRQRSVFWGKNEDVESDSCSTTSDEDEDDDESDFEDRDQNDDKEEESRQLVYANWPNRLADILNKKDKVIRVEKTNFRLDDETLFGKVLVRNLDYHKTVMIRYTFDFWETVENVQAIYRESTSKKMYDVFSFSIEHVPDKKPNAVLYFAIYYKVGGQEYWDNNDGKNYEIQIVTKKSSTTNKQSSPIQDKSILSEPLLIATNKKEDGLSARYSFGQSIHQAKKPPMATTTHHHHHHHQPTHHLHQNTTSANNNKPEVYLHKSSSSPSLSSLSDTTSTPPSQTVAMAMPIPRRKSAATRDAFPLFSSSPTSCHSPLASSPNSLMDLNSQSYMDLVNKYCFYSTSPSRSPMSING